jgi:arginine:pyruvate transaminase
MAKHFRAKGVSVLDATAFGLASEGHVRVAFTVSDEALEEAGRRIVAFAAEINSSAAVA